MPRGRTTTGLHCSVNPVSDIQHLLKPQTQAHILAAVLARVVRAHVDTALDAQGDTFLYTAGLCRKCRCILRGVHGGRWLIFRFSCHNATNFFEGVCEVQYALQGRGCAGAVRPAKPSKLYAARWKRTKLYAPGTQQSVLCGASCKAKQVVRIIHSTAHMLHCIAKGLRLVSGA